MDKYLIEIDAVIGFDGAPTADEVSDLIEMVVDDLDRDGVEPGMSTRVTEDGDVVVTIEVTVKAADGYAAMATAMPLFKRALDSTGMNTDRLFGAGHKSTFRASQLVGV